ncbi:amino acid ABC transporter permease [Oricola thermophila]|uniref:Amino acid ABC transporter permease n=1 Tax=Oricola thermophila TaxID=2742145 RepID=A0A6N1VHW6_9HYPH|nr:amino acid ABC transporter permease [Oricola thermophila]QKV20023.1 amino acid ABC transporter permease [Oricola thermophila]
MSDTTNRDAELNIRPPRQSGLEQFRAAYFGSIPNTLITLGGLLAFIYIGWSLLHWAFLDAIFSVEGGAQACQAAEGACWSVIFARWRLMFFGLYPYEEHWRSALACIIVIGVGVLSCMPAFWSARKLAAMWGGGLLAFIVLMRGGVFGLSLITEEQWGGLSLTIFIFASVALIGMPMAIAFALMRRSAFPFISVPIGLVIDTVRSLPLITILFTVAVVVPVVVPSWLLGDKLYRVIGGMALFFAAYQAEIIRSGIQSLPVGQEEASKALGLSYWQRMTRIILPQAFRRALPPTINQFVITFKETSLIIIVGLFEFLASGNAAYGSGEWAFAYVEVYVFIGLVYFIFVFSLSRYGAYLERLMRVGKL